MPTPSPRSAELTPKSRGIYGTFRAAEFLKIVAPFICQLTLLKEQRDADESVLRKKCELFLKWYERWQNCNRKIGDTDDEGWQI